MRKNQFILITFLFFLFFANISQAQLYKSALGIRLGNTNGITYKTFVKSNRAFEAIATFRRQGFGLTGLYEVHGRAFNSRDFNWLIGGGGHIYGWNRGYYKRKYSDNERNYVIGLDGILGLEVKLRTVPLAISLDWKPTIDFINYSGYTGDEVALSLRYTW
jgi:hypothetical protein